MREIDLQIDDFMIDCSARGLSKKTINSYGNGWKWKWGRFRFPQKMKTVRIKIKQIDICINR